MHVCLTHAPSRPRILPPLRPSQIPVMVFDTLLRRDGEVEHPGSLSYMFFAFANFIAHWLFSTNKRDWAINDTLSYLDSVRCMALVRASRIVLVTFNPNHNVSMLIARPSFSPNQCAPLRSSLRPAYSTPTNGLNPIPALYRLTRSN